MNINIDSAETSNSDAHTGLDTTRVSVREINEISWRALAVLGVSPGEAATAAVAITFTEIHFGGGLELIAAEPTKIGIESRRFELHEAQIDILDCPESTGLLMAAPLAVDLVAARPASRAVLVRGYAWDPIVIGFMRKYHGATASALFAFEIVFGAVARGAMMTADGSLVFLDKNICVGIWLSNPQLAVGLSSDHHGLLFTQESLGLTGVNIPPTHSNLELAQTYERALAAGVRMDALRWHSVYEIAARYLVPEQ